MKLAVWVLLSLVSSIVVAEAQRDVPCYFLFGDSIVDNGNNNDVPVTDAKANYAPYGVDLPNFPRGRFTNGLTVADIIGKLLGFDKLIPSFLTARGNAIVRGVNYASAGAGIRDETGNRRGVTSLRRQVKHHGVSVATMGPRLGLIGTQTHLNKCIYSIYIGSNDYINNYFMPSEYPTSRIYTPDQYATVLVRQYCEQIQALYLLGARKIAMNGLGSIGCIPLLLNGTSCATAINNASAIFNTRLQAAVPALNRRLQGARITFINGLSNATSTILAGVPNYGPCCEVASGEELCVPNGNICANRDEYIFWDNVHPTENTNNATARVAYYAPLMSDATPYGFRTLALLP